MQTRSNYIVLTALCAILTLNGCAWTKRTWNRVWGKEDTETQEQAKQQTEQDGSIVTGSEGDIPAAGGQQPGATARTETMPPGMPEAQAPATSSAQAPAAPTGDLPSATSTPAPASAPPAADAQGAAGDMAMAEPKGQVVTLQADALFAFGKSDLSMAGKSKLDDLAARLSGMDKAALGSISVVGHADRLGAAERNQVLSERRAEAVKTYLAGHGVDGAMIKTEGRGSSDPVVNCPGNKATKKLISCLAPNRRVEVVINAR